jgi:hypothetical protein
MHFGVVRLSFNDGTPDKFFWWASEDPQPDREEIFGDSQRERARPLR